KIWTIRLAMDIHNFTRLNPSAVRQKYLSSFVETMKQRELGELGELGKMGKMRETGKMREMRKSCSRVMTETSVCRGGFRN
ncbi:MAG: hypothetical protein ACOC2Z_02055, partial [Coleofasciculus sp.]